MRWGRRVGSMVRHAGLALGCAAALAAGLALAEGSRGVSPAWIVDGLVLGVLLQSEQRALRRHGGAALLGAGAAWIASGQGGRDGLLTLAASLVFILVARGGLARIGWRAADMATARGLLRGAGVVLGVAPLAAAVVMMAGAGAAAGAGSAAAPVLWWVSEVLGVAIVTPLVLTLGRRDAMLLAVPPLLTSSLVLGAVYAAIAGGVFLQDRLPLDVLIFPPLLLLVGRLGFPGAGLGILVTALIAALGAVLGHGPPGGATMAHGRLISLQFLLVVASVMVYPTAAVVSERRRMNQALSDQHSRLSRNEHLYRLLADHASDIITRERFDGRRLYVSPSVKDVLGWTPEEMMDPQWQRHVHPDDLAGFIATRERVRDGAAHVSNTYRYLRRDGAWCWLEARLHLVRAADGRAKEFVANLRDITRQKETELALEAAMAKLAEQATTDGLTGVANRWRFDEALDQEWRRALRGAEDLAVLLIDADHFKAFNDRYGHQAGDDCLRAIATAIALAVRRSGDVVARYGGEEFVVILPATGQAGAREVAERIRAAIEALRLPHDGNAGGVVTVSIGVSAMTVLRQHSAAALVEAADQALYRAKRAGRNRVDGDGAPAAGAVVASSGPLRPRPAADAAPPRDGRGAGRQDTLVVGLLNR